MPPSSVRLSPLSLLYWAGPSLLLMGTIYWLGTDRASAAETGSLLERLFAVWPALVERLGPETMALMNVGIRKFGHFSGYGLLGLLNARCFRGLCGTLTKQGSLIAWVAAAGWAAADEYHQSFSASRGGSPSDVLLDAIGAAAGILVYHLCLRCRPPKS